MALENISILSFTSAIDKINMTTLAPFCDNEDSENVIDDGDEHYDISNMSDFASEVIIYIAGSVVHYLIKKIKCETCVSVLIKPDIFNENAQFIKLKDNGGLLIPSKDVITICKKTEVLLKSIVFDKKVINSK